MCVQLVPFVHGYGWITGHDRQHQCSRARTSKGDHFSDTRTHTPTRTFTPPHLLDSQYRCLPVCVAVSRPLSFWSFCRTPGFNVVRTFQAVEQYIGLLSIQSYFY